MNIEQKLDIVRKFLEVGGEDAYINLNLHSSRDSFEQTAQLAEELSPLFSEVPTFHKVGKTSWFKFRSGDYSVDIAVFHDHPEYMEEDVDLSGGEEHAI